MTPIIPASTVADYVIARIADHGSSHIFGVGGANIEDVYDAINRFGEEMTGIVAKHEFAAAAMADGYSRNTNRLGVVAATSGGGALNLIAALGESFDSRVPVLALVGQPTKVSEGRGAFQDTSGRAGTIDAEILFAQVSRFCAKPTSGAQVPELLERALTSASQGGPAVLLLTKDIQRSGICDLATSMPSATAPEPEPSVGLDRAEALIASVDGAVVVIAGPEVARADARAELESFAVALGARVAVAPDAKDVFRNSHPLFAGVTGIMGHLGVAELIADASLIVVVGTPLPQTARGGLDAAFATSRIVHLGSQPPFLEAEISVAGPIGKNLVALAGVVDRRGPIHPDGPGRPLPLRVPPATGPGVRYSEAIAAISAQLPPGTDVFADAGNTGAAVVHHLLVPDDGRFVVALGMGGMGYSFGAGIGSALGRSRRTFVIAGDGSFFMHGLEVHTAVEYQIPVTFIVFNNNAHGMCLTREQLYYSGKYTFNTFSRAHIGESIAALFPGITARAASTIAEVELALAETAAASGPVFISLECDPEEIPPFAPFLEEFTS
ncbi:thiamine pyrophosphate-binding protein [Rhodococcus oxybenzonivorans]|uniref:thiamine pyrophosphate-binding protein n=1 Tax=Rhodococcus oxybenzonivorans TaxID=1990687 RepID=UPI00194F61D4|nr:thiamine pyrophosphate-binding protein [Rhodococcus oxybenzonivorans]